MLKKILLVIGAVVILAAVVESLTAQPGPRGGDFGGRRGGRGFSAAPQYPPTAVNEEEKKILSVLNDMDRNQRGGNMNVPVEDGRILRMLTEAVGAKHVVEIGTSNGYSGIWFCLALRATGGKLTTHDIDEGRAALARRNFKRAGVDNIVTLVMGDAHETVKNIKESIDVLFIDADKPGYVDYLQKLLPLVRPGGLILGHNVNMGSRMQDYIKAITTDANLETVFQGQGQDLSITLKKRLSK
jgi:predicted O-methyltransferase YrrM